MEFTTGLRGRLLWAVVGAIVSLPTAAPAQQSPAREIPPPTAAEQLLLDRLETKAQERRNRERAQAAGKPTGLGTDLPRPELPPDLPNKVRTMFADMWQEVERLQAAGERKEASVLAIMLRENTKALRETQLPLTDDRAELHVISLHDGLPDPADKRAKEPRKIVEVKITYTEQPIVLALCAREQVHWKLDVQAGVQIKQVILSGYSQQDVEGLPEKTPVRARQDGGVMPFKFYAYQQKDELFLDLARQLYDLTRLQISTYQGAYTYNGVPFLIGKQNDDWRLQLTVARLDPLHRSATQFREAEDNERMQAVRFPGVWQKNVNSYSRFVLAEFTPLGPVATTMTQLPFSPQHLTIDPKGPSLYYASDKAVYRFDGESGESIKLPAFGNAFPQVIRICGLAMDTHRRRLLLADRRNLYAFDIALQEWSMLTNLEGRELQSLSYSAEKDVLYALHGLPHTDTLRTLEPDGTQISSVKIHGDILAKRSRLNVEAQVIAVGEMAAILGSPMPELSAEGYPLRSHCYLVDPQTGQIHFSQPLLPQSGLPDSRFQQPKMEELWQKLLSDDLFEAELTIWQLSAAGEELVPFLREHLDSLLKRPIDEKRVAALVKQLNDTDYRQRIAARRELTKFGELIKRELSEAAADAASTEQLYHLRQLLIALEKSPTTPTQRRDFRAMRALSRSDTPEAIEFLQELAEERRGSARSEMAEELLHLTAEVRIERDETESNSNTVDVTD